MMRRLYPNFVGGRAAVALLLVRLVMGAAFILHGWPKIQNPFGWMNAMGGSSIPSWLQGVAAFAEFGGGFALILGLLTPIAAFGLVCQMVAALLIVHLPRGDPFVASAPGQSSYELALVYLVIAISIILFGPGKLSLDALIFGRRNAPE
jgi:putative oxidoreductase